MKKQMLSSIALAALLCMGLYAFAAPAAHATPAASRATVVRMSGPTANADFSVQNGDITTEVFVSVADQKSQTSPGKPTTGPMIDYLLVSEYNSTTGQLFFNAIAQPTPAPGFEIDSKGLDSAYLPPTAVTVQPVDEYGAPTAPAFDITLQVSWTGTGPIFFNSTTSHDRIPHVLNFTSHFSGMSRDATAVGTFSYTSPRTNASVEVTDAASAFAQLANSRVTYIVVQHAPFPG